MQRSIFQILKFLTALDCLEQQAMSNSLDWRHIGRQVLCILLIGYAVLFVSIPMVRGGDTYVRIHDNLNNVFEHYIVLKHNDALFNNSVKTISGFMGSVPRDTLLIQTVFTFRVFAALFSPLWFWYITQLFIRGIALWGMWSVLNTICRQKLQGHAVFQNVQTGIGNNGKERKNLEVVFLAISVVFATLPFESASGLGIAGIPMVVAVFVRAKQQAWAWYDVPCLLVYVYSVVFSYAPIFLIFWGVVWYGYLLFRKQMNGTLLIYGAVFIVLLLVANWHEYATAASDAVPTIRTVIRDSDAARSISLRKIAARSVRLLIVGDDWHASSFHITVFFLAVFSSGLMAGRSIMPSVMVWVLLCMIACSILAYVLYVFPIGALVEQVLPLLKAFNWSRFYLLLPVLWWLLAGALLYEIRDNLNMPMVLVVMLPLLCLQLAINVYYGDGIQTRQKQEPSFRSFFAERQFGAVRKRMEEESDGLVRLAASLGIYPAVLHVNGIHTIDGYHSVAPYAGHEEFRAVIADELTTHTELRELYDSWGAYRYLFSGELYEAAGKNLTVYKSMDIKAVKELRINTTALWNLNTEWIVSAVKIGNAEELHLQLVEVFYAEQSAYDVYLYRIIL